MNEQEFIYGKLKYLTESVNFLIGTAEKQQDMIEQLTDVISIMQSPEYAKKQSDTAKISDVMEKINLMRNIYKEENQ